MKPELSKPWAPRLEALRLETLEPAAMEPAFNKLFKPSRLYRSTGVVLFKMEDDTITQPDLFGVTARIERISNMLCVIVNIMIPNGSDASLGIICIGFRTGGFG